MAEKRNASPAGGEQKKRIIEVVKVVGIIKFENGDVYDGEIKDEEPHGKGVMTYADGKKLDFEDWKNGVATGKGVETEVDGTVYTGEFKEGYWHGKGVCTHDNGDVYDGE